MAFAKTANAVVVKPGVGARGWGKVRTASTGGSTQPAKNLVAQASEILGEPFNPDKYLLTHCTIVASVDVETVQGAKIGRLRKGTKKINRKYADYYITPSTSQYVNNNGDCWARDTLLASFRTFIGSHNFQEHVQIEEHSKGRIIDAVARDIGESVYVDILVATDRKHSTLVKDIESGKLGTLSMGCTVDFTICSKCGNVAIDETDLCDHIKYHKLDTFYDESGNRRVIAELCGHPSIDPTGGVTFIEASWVAQPAFTGAVMRNILDVGEVTPEVAKRAAEILTTVPAEWVVDPEMRRKAAGFGFGDEQADEEAPAEEAAPAGLLEELEQEVEQAVVDKVEQSIRKQIRKDDLEDAVQPDSMAPNDTLVKEARLRAAYDDATISMVRKASSDAGLVNGIAELDAAFGLSFPRGLYRASLRVGASSRYPTLGSFLDACTQAMERPVTPQEAKKMLRLGKFLSVLETSKNPPRLQGEM